MKEVSCQFFDERAPMFQALANRIALNLEEAVKTRGLASLAVSGGSTPLPLFQALNTADIPWEKVQITLVDERWVSPDHERSNERLVREHLLIHGARAASFTGLKTAEPTPEEGLESCNQNLKALSLPFDAVVLGMGDDGHTASFFPFAASLESALNPKSGQLCAAIRAENAGEPRITLTLPALLQSANLFLLCCGQSKREVFENAQQEGAIAEMPIRAVLKASTPLSFYWAP